MTACLPGPVWGRADCFFGKNGRVQPAVAGCFKGSWLRRPAFFAMMEGNPHEGEDEPVTLSEKILALRTRRGMSQGDVADALEVSRQSVSKWETGQSVPDLDKIIRLADLFGVTVDELVREGERPAPPEPPEPRVVYIKEEKRGLTILQRAGVCLEVCGGVLLLMGAAGLGAAASLIGAALMILSLPLLLARKHPWLILGWLAVGMSLLVLNPNISVAPWGLIGGLKYLYWYLTIPELHYSTILFAAAVGITRGLVVLLLFFGAWRAWRRSRAGKPDADQEV